MNRLMLIGIAAVLAGCSGGTAPVPIERSTSDRHLDETTFDSDALAMVQRDTGLSLPRGSRGLQMFYQGASLDPSFVAKIQIPTDDGEHFISQIQAITNQEGTVSGSLTEKVSWWAHPDSAIRLQRQWNPHGNYVRAIVTEDNDGLVLYVEWIKI
jgi:hypothetical protein